MEYTYSLLFTMDNGPDEIEYLCGDLDKGRCVFEIHGHVLLFSMIYFVLVHINIEHPTSDPA